MSNQVERFETRYQYLEWYAERNEVDLDALLRRYS